jgi:hypothetical protein
MMAVALALLVTPAVRAEDAEPSYPSAETVLAHPEAVNPFTYAVAVKWLWQQGRRQQAAFWFYMFQARTRPWSLADTGGEGLGALRGALNDELGSVINSWVGSDPAAWRNIAERAIAFERRLPLSPERPEGLDAAAWRRLVATSRADYAAQMQEAFAGLDAEKFAANRRSAGLRVGPLEQPGPALPDAWR